LVAMILKVNFLVVLIAAAVLAIPLYRLVHTRGVPGSGTKL
jgi:hypothetical protein